jgi:mono/diheme cytochrome c family protein
MKKIKYTFFTLAFSGSVFVSCNKHDSNSPGFEYMPDMYRSPSKEVYGAQTLFGDTIYLQKPVKGTIARGYMPYTYPNTPEGYEEAGKNLKNPIPVSDQVISDGSVLYGKYCIHCHGGSGGGDGSVGQKLPGAPPSYLSPALMNLSEGKMFHTITYGKGLMGAHAPMLTQEERWKLVHYIHKLQSAGAPAPAATTAEPEKKETTAKK